MPTTVATDQDSAEASAILTDHGYGQVVGFPTAEAVRLAASLLGTPVQFAPIELAKRHRVLVSPGSIRLRVMERSSGYEEGPKPAPYGRQFRDSLIDTAYRQALDESAGPVQSCTEELPSYSRWWSARSRARMVRTLATVDWAPVISARACRPAMVTLTYPGDWMAVAPDSTTTKRHLDLFGKRLRRLYEVNGLAKPGAVWKLEFQKRGAPHFHLYLPVPVAKIRCSCNRWCTDRVRFAEWLSQTWASIVGAQGDEHERHLRAGTGVDFAEGSRMSDPKRLAVYFVRHNAKGGKSKAYQHRVPGGWAKAGRWWGTWGLSRVEAEVEVEPWELLEVRRLLRRWVDSQEVKGKRSGDPWTVRECSPRCAPMQVPRGIASTGEQRRRWVSRRYRIGSLRQSLGGFVVANDGPALAAMISRHLEYERAKRTDPRAGPGRGRVLP